MSQIEEEAVNGGKGVSTYEQYQSIPLQNMNISLQLTKQPMMEYGEDKEDGYVHVHSRSSFIGDTYAVTLILQERYKHRDREFRSCEREDHGGRASSDDIEDANLIVIA
ncbi:hypothetical protein F2Q70_00036343 [Brassica cretica]|uniref:Uncharacterized protein n=1 Tax=Brassica cretica TaxID=69181 RepID=A0A8S9JZN6_BRACR|nr:hypothetical protein F2Q68_00003753 [Brassica cretica]KAF2587319.1 hypothetical protein F2Q70_00036343 [Brassica cretica]